VADTVAGWREKHPDPRLVDFLLFRPH